MIRRHGLWSRWMYLSLISALALGCDYSPPPNSVLTRAPVATPRGGDSIASKPGQTTAQAPRDSAERATILASSIEMIQRAALQPGGDNFGLATRKLNQYFEGTPASEYLLDSASRAYLEGQLPRAVPGSRDFIAESQNREWTNHDARHLEDCMLYSSIAGRIAQTGDDLSRVSRVFDWVVRQIQLVPGGSLGSRQLPHVIARPYDLLLRGMATESEGYWAERSWLFISLCGSLASMSEF